MSANTKDLIKQYFNSLVQEFIKDPLHNQHITVIFTDYIGKSDSGEGILGTTKQSGGGGHTTSRTENGVEIPGSRKTTYFPYKYTITFLNHYKDEEKWRETVAHEFAHLYLLTKLEIDHDHDDRFYSHMEKFENWMDNKWGLSPRKDKSGDWNQHIDQSKHQERQKKPCTSCGKREIPHNTAGQCCQCHEKEKEYNQLVDLMKNAKNLTELEQVYQTVKNNPLYDINKRTFKKFNNTSRTPKDNKTELDIWYNDFKRKFQSRDSNNNQICEKCGEKEKLKMTSTDLCYLCRRKEINSMFEEAKENLKEAKKLLEKSLTLGDSSLIKDAEGVVVKNEATLKNAELSYLVSLVNDVIDLTILEENYQKVKDHSLYSKNQSELDSRYQKRKEVLAERERERERESKMTRDFPIPKNQPIELLGLLLVV